MTKTIKYKRHKKTSNLKLQKKIYSGGNNLICGKEKSYIDNILDDKTALGLSVPTTTEELSKQYKKLSLIFHPDKCKDDKATDTFRKINDRYLILTKMLKSSPIPSIFPSHSTPAEEIARWYATEFSRSPKRDTSPDSLEPVRNILDITIIDNLEKDFIKMRNELRNIQDDDAITIDYKLNLIKKSSRKLNLSLLKINSLIYEIDLLIEQINIIDSELILFQSTFNEYVIPESLNDHVQWLRVHLNGYRPLWSPEWKELVIELQEKANQLKSKLIKRKNNILSRLTRRSTIVKIPDLGRITRKLRRS